MGLTWSNDLRFDELSSKLTAAMPEAIKTGLGHIAEVSGEQTPIEEGTLLRSQEIIVDEPDSGFIRYRTPYAHRQHEDARYKHPHGNFKYLERPMQTEAGTALQITGQKLDEALGE